MRIGILTFHRADNYGALLQAYALYTVLSKKEPKTELIDYRCKAIENFYQYGLFPHLSKNPKYWPALFKELHAKKLQKKRCIQFREAYLPLSSSYYNDSDRAEVEERYDLIVTGSDQVWNPGITAGKNDWYAFHRQSKHATIVSYAASVGGLHSFQFYFRFYQSDLNSYDLISVREKNASEYLSRELKKPTFCALDPTLLMEKAEWEKMIRKQKVEKEPYLLYYDVTTNKVARKIAERIAQEKNLKLIHFNRSIRNSNTSHYVQMAGPLEFLTLLHQAAVVVTSSFHGTVFSIQFEKRFIAIPHPNTADRVIELLSVLELKDRICENDRPDVLDIIDREIDYSHVKQKLSALRIQSLNYLDQCIGLAEEKCSKQEGKEPVL